ncbi:hypothetical protein OWV82_003758 [Melia azedarach]|uniref:Uncharacterized protein n=1 Tax=Melia azedarach TaxID=155640 RepID=A0ACC1YQD8_MELAZ|nr:hypothetical protein OWV82_003758 [Melia azedarach]
MTFDNPFECNDVRANTLPISIVGRFRSEVWEHFDRVEINRERKTICKYCKMKSVARPKDDGRPILTSIEDVTSTFMQGDVEDFEEVKIVYNN